MERWIGTLSVRTDYDGQGNAFQITSYSTATGGSVVNQVQRAFNGLGQLVKEYQAHNGAVNTSSTPNVQYGYSAMAGGANHSRLTSLTYPSGTVLSYGYASGIDDAVSRLSSLSDSTGVVEDYTYIGHGTVVERGHPTVDLSYIGTGPGDAGDRYVGLDRFGRVVDQRWTDGAGSVDRFQYGYDRNGSRLWKDTSSSQFGSIAFSELYAYDGLNQIASFDRGTLNSTKTAIAGTPSRTQDWDFDGLGNWNSVTTDGVTQTRSDNAQNEIASVSGATSPVFDANGNMLTDETNKDYTYDAWNRPITVKNASNVTIATYEYDGLTRRIQETQSGTTTGLYYSTAWQVLEERAGGDGEREYDGTQYIWSPVYIDALVLRDRDTDNDGESDPLDERLWVIQDANFNVTALVDSTGTVVERYTYTPFGVATVHDRDYTVDSSGSDYEWLYRHQGGRWSAASNLVHFRHREYSPTLGRWLSLDPLRHRDGSNHFCYLHNDPFNNTDSQGLCADVKDDKCKLLKGPLPKVNNRFPINGNPGGETIKKPGAPKDGIKFSKDGYPDFTPCECKIKNGKQSEDKDAASVSVTIKYTGNRKKDYDAANKQAKLQNTPKGRRLRY
jgi:RHS repeat-associated protein